MKQPRNLLAALCFAAFLTGCGADTSVTTTAPPPPMTEEEQKAQEQHYSQPTMKDRQ